MTLLYSPAQPQISYRISATYSQPKSVKFICQAHLASFGFVLAALDSNGQRLALASHLPRDNGHFISERQLCVSHLPIDAFCMSKAEPFSELITELSSLGEIDPFALLGVSISTDDKRLTKRYRQVAKQLHPDALLSTAAPQGLTPNVAAQVISRLINPAYQKLKHQKTRTETITLLRLRVRRLVRSEKLIPTFLEAQQLEAIEEADIDVFYEQALSQLASVQFCSLDDLRVRSLTIGQINLIYLQRKMSDLVIRSKPAGLVASASISADTPTSLDTRIQKKTDGKETDTISASHLFNSQNQAPGSDTASGTNFVRQHTNRAKIYLTQKNYEKAVQELRDALKLSPQNPEIHSMIGQTYYKQNMSGMAKAHFRQALKLKPDHKVALKYGKLLSLTSEGPAAKQPYKRPDSTTQPNPVEQQPKAADPPTASRAWLGRLLNR